MPTPVACDFFGENAGERHVGIAAEADHCVISTSISQIVIRVLSAQTRRNLAYGQPI
jgi:hypothetical protein